MAARTANLVITVLLLGGPALAQQLTPAPAPPANPPATASQAVATSGLLPIYGVELGVDKTWIDGANFPSQSTDFPNAGVNASFKQVWDGLKPAGFNFVRIGVDVYDLPASTNRAANVCNWAKNNNVKVLLVLLGTSSGDYASAAAGFVKALANALKQGAYKTTYAQIAAYELAPDLNNPSLLLQVSSSAKAQDLLLATATQIRATETDALKGSGIDSTPLVVRASFDYELMSAKAIAGTTLADDAYKSAYASLVHFLKPLAASPNIDLIAVDWFPGSISAGGVDKPPVLLRSIATDLPGKQFLFTTGFSTAFHTDDEQKQYYSMTFANLGDLRASGGPSSPFVGVIYRGAMNAKSPAAPDPSLPQAVAKWDWPSKAAELASMWTDQKKSDEMNWWVESVRDTMGLLQAQSDAFDAAAVKPKAGMLTLTQISSAVASASAGTAGAAPGQPMPGAAPGQPATPGAVPGQKAPSGVVGALGQTVQTKATQLLSGLLDNVMQKLTTMEQTGLNGGGGGFSGMPNAGNGFGSSAMLPQPGGANGFATPCPATPMVASPSPASLPGMPTDPSAMTPVAAPCTSGIPGNSFASPSVPAMPTSMPSAPVVPAPANSGATSAGGAMPAVPASTASATQPATGSPNAAAGNAPSSSAPVSTNAALGSAAASIPASTGLPAGSITLTKQDISLQPANPTVGQPVQITANLHNQGTSAAAGVTVLASGAKNAVLSEADSIQLPPNSTYTASMQWIPKDASATVITVRVSDGTGTQMATVALDPVNVVAASGAGAGKVRSPIGSSTTGAPAATTVGNSSVASVGSAATGASAGRVDSNTDTSTTLVPLGFAKIGDIEAQNLVAGTPGSILLTISDPLLVPLTNIKAVLTLDGKVVQTQSAAMLLPQQSRSIVFSNLIIAQPGTHEARVGVQLMRAGKSQLGAVSQDIVVQASTAAWNKVSNTQVSTAANSAKTAQSQSHLRSLTPTVPTGVAATVASAAPSTASPGLATAATASQSSLTLRASDLSYSPAPASPGQAVTFHIVVRNSGNVAVQQAALALSLYADGKLVAGSQSPIQFSVAANSTYQANWQAAMPAGREVQFMASVTGEGSPSSALGKASIVLQSVAPIAPKVTAPAKPTVTKHL